MFYFPHLSPLSCLYSPSYTAYIPWSVSVITSFLNAHNPLPSSCLFTLAYDKITALINPYSAPAPSHPVIPRGPCRCPAVTLSSLAHAAFFFWMMIFSVFPGTLGKLLLSVTSGLLNPVVSAPPSLSLTCQVHWCSSLLLPH